MLLVLASEFGAGTGDAAMVVSWFAIAYVCVQLVHGPFGDRHGRYARPCRTRQPARPVGPISIRYSGRLAEAGIGPSVGSKGDSYDNALAGTINGLYKAELIHRRAPWKTREAVELATLEQVSRFNHHRLLEPISCLPPAEAEADPYRQLASRGQDIAA